jgi:hypothetical protein
VFARCQRIGSRRLHAAPIRKEGRQRLSGARRVTGAAANIRSICYNDADLSAFRVRMVQQQLVVGVLHCKGADGKLHLDDEYAAFVKKFNPELGSNAVEMKSLVGRKKANLDVMVTEIANRTAQRPTQDSAFCSRHQRALEWALLAEVTTLTQVPAPYDLGPEMKIFSCPKS